MQTLNLVLGTPECSIESVVSVIDEDEKIIENWTALARALDISNAGIKKFQQDLLLNKISYSDLLYEVLERWVGLKGKDAKLVMLILVMEEECKAVKVGESIRLHFNLPKSINESILWDNLPKALQVRAISNLQKLIPSFPIEDIKSNLNGIVLRQLIRGPPYTLPESLSYYVNRTILTRNIISTNIFEKYPNHIFLISGIESYELSKFAKSKTTDNSSNQILQGKLTVRHMKLELPHHFDKICEITGDPVHWFSFKDNKLKWIRSRGGISAVQEFIDKSQDSLPEEDFVTSFQLDSNRPICISDSPGMGKSVFLAEIGRKLVGLYPDRAVIFLVLGEVIKTIKEIDIIGLLHQTKNTDKNGISVELLLDGFDEVDSSEREFAFELLRTIRTCCKSIRMWVTSRPHLLDQLEMTLETIGFNIQPFSVDDQVRFLTSYWLATNPNIKNMDKLATFANQSLTTLVSTMNSEAIDIAGVPLQCLLIGEVFQDEASAFSNSEESTSPTILITSITQLYKSLIHRKFQKSGLKDSETMMDMHACLSVKLIFPEQFEKLEHLFDPVEIEEILRIGILQASNMSAVPRFLHRTFAEYFVAWFVRDRLNRSTDENFVDFFVTYFLECTDRKSRLFLLFRNFEHDPVYPQPFKNIYFSQDILAYFFNSLIDNFQSIPTSFASDLTKSLKFKKIIQEMAWACVNRDRLQIFKLFIELNVFEKQKVEIFDRYILFQSLALSSLEFVKIVLELFEEHHSFSEDVQLQALEFAVRRGKFSIVEFLVKERQLHRMVEKLNWHYDGLVKLCIFESLECTSLEIDEKIQIIRMLSDINPALVDMKNEFGNTPLLTKYVHIRLRIELIRLGANVLNVNDNSETVLHLGFGWNIPYSKLGINTDFHSLMLTIPDETLRKLVRVKDSGSSTPLHQLLWYFDPVPVILDVFKKVGADFNSVDQDGDSPLLVALKCGRNGSTIRKLIECGANVHHKKGWKRKSLLHLAAKKRNVLPESIAVLLEWIDVDVRDLSWKTPMDYAKKRGNVYVQKFQQGITLAGKSCCSSS